MAASGGRDAGAVAAAAAPARLGVDRDRLAAPDRRATTSTWSTSAPRRHPRRDRDRRAGGRQARAVREAAGQHRRRGRGDGRRRGRAPRRAASGRWSGFTYRRVPGDRAGPPAGRRGPARHDPARAGAVPAGLDRRPGRSRWSGGCRRSKAGSGALGDIGAHIIDLTQFVTGRAHHRGQRADRDLRHASGRCRRPRPGWPAVGGGPGTRRGHRRRRGAVPRPVRPAARWPRSRRPGSPPAARTRSGSRSTARDGSLAFDFEAMNELQFYDDTEDAEHGRLPPDPRHRADPPVRRRLVAARPRPRLRAHASPTRSSTWSTAIGDRRGPGAVVRRRAPGAAGAGRGRAVGGARQRLGAGRRRPDR